jgi:hypothetical protein
MTPAPKITLNYFNANGAYEAPPTTRTFECAIATGLEKLLEAGEWGVARDEIPPAVIPRIAQSGFIIEWFHDHRFDGLGNRPTRPRWARLRGVQHIKIVEEVA